MTTASVPAIAHQPAWVSRPVRAATPRNPSATPAIRTGPTGSWGRNLAARRNVKIGTVDWAIPAMLESTCVSPQATSPIGSAALMTPSTRHGFHAARSSCTARVTPMRTAR
jgi:hypothetical protein